MKLGSSIIKPWKWRSIFRARKAMRELGQLVVLRKKYEKLIKRKQTIESLRIMKAKHREVHAVINARLNAFTFHE